MDGVGEERLTMKKRCSEICVFDCFSWSAWHQKGWVGGWDDVFVLIYHSWFCSLPFADFHRYLGNTTWLSVRMNRIGAKFWQVFINGLLSPQTANRPTWGFGYPPRQRSTAQGICCWSISFLLSSRGYAKQVPLLRVTTLIKLARHSARPAQVLRDFLQVSS